MPRILNQLGMVLTLLADGSFRYRSNPISILSSISRLLASRFSLSEIRALALADPALPDKVPSRYYPKDALWPIYEAMNHFESNHYVDKSLILVFLRGHPALGFDSSVLQQAWHREY